MSDTREKLIELLSQVQYLGGLEEKIADHLIANGVTISKMETVATDNNVGHKWIPVTERLPERNTEVLVCDTREDYVSVWEYMGDGLWYGNDVIWATEDITHWMDLPETPKGE